LKDFISSQCGISNRKFVACSFFRARMSLYWFRLIRVCSDHWLWLFVYKINFFVSHVHYKKKLNYQQNFIDEILSVGKIYYRLISFVAKFIDRFTNGFILNPSIITDGLRNSSINLHAINLLTDFGCFWLICLVSNFCFCYSGGPDIVVYVELPKQVKEDDFNFNSIYECDIITLYYIFARFEYWFSLSLKWTFWFLNDFELLCV